MGRGASEKGNQSSDREGKTFGKGTTRSTRTTTLALTWEFLDLQDARGKEPLKRPLFRWLVVLYTSGNIFPTGEHFRRKNEYTIGATSRTCAKDRFRRPSFRARGVRLDDDSRGYKRVCTLKTEGGRSY